MTKNEHAALVAHYKKAITYYETTAPRSNAHSRGFALGYQGAADEALAAVGFTWAQRYDIWHETLQEIAATADPAPPGGPQTYSPSDEHQRARVADDLAASELTTTGPG